MTKQNIRIGFIGAGSIGSLFGGYLANVKSSIYKIEVIFFNKKLFTDVLNKDGLIISRNKEDLLIKNIKGYKNEKYLEDIIRNDPSFKFDFMFLTTKAYDNENALRQYKNLINASSYLVVLQNGIGNEDIAIEFFEKTKIIRAVTSNGALLNKPGYLLHTGDGITMIGFPFLDNKDLKLEELAQCEFSINLLKDILNLAGLNTIIAENIVIECWEKGFVNIGINPIGALTRLSNGKLLENEGLKDLIAQTIKEAIETAKKKDVKLPEKDYIAIAYDTAKKTADNKNSMLQDVLNRKTTEIDFLNGRIVKYAKQLGVKAPINKILTYLIKGLENSRI